MFEQANSVVTFILYRYKSNVRSEITSIFTQTKVQIFIISPALNPIFFSLIMYSPKWVPSQKGSRIRRSKSTDGENRRFEGTSRKFRDVRLLASGSYDRPAFEEKMNYSSTREETKQKKQVIKTKKMLHTIVNHFEELLK